MAENDRSVIRKSKNSFCILSTIDLAIFCARFLSYEIEDAWG